MSLILELVEHTGLSAAELRWIIYTAPKRYRSFPIAKRSGGERIIAQPSRELKLLQRYVLDHKLNVFPVHQSAMAYEHGTSILRNATEHQGSDFLIKMDFKNFFPSITNRDWEILARRTRPNSFDLSEIQLYSKILFWGGPEKSIRPEYLSIGAPSSPRVSNIIMFELDKKIFAIANSRGVSYSRYADDITLSGNDLSVVQSVESTVRKLVAKSRSPRFEFNDDKRGVYGRSVRRMVTGLVLTPDGRISIGRARKREISALIHRSALNQLLTDERGRLKGLLGFCAATEPDFIGRMRTKYGDLAIDVAMKFHVPRRAKEPEPE